MGALSNATSGHVPWELSHTRKRRASQVQHRAEASPAYLLAPEIAIGERTNNQLITHSLLQIYHDVLENNLACWLAEENCPYKMSAARSGALVSLSPRARVQAPEWGTIWSNRMYQRVLQLDRVAQRTGQIRLTQRESQAASRALDLAIMAFATQYAQGKRRDGMPTGEALFSDARDSFEEILQQSIWEQARQALQDVSGVESYRVVYAELIFGFVDSPDIEEDVPHRGGYDGETTTRVWKDGILHKVHEMIADTAPPVTLDRAARKVQILRSKFEMNEAECSELAVSQAQRNLADEERKTIGLLYWLAVMLDTVSSSMNERPVALADEECQQDVVQEKQAQAASEASSPEHARWEVETFAPPSSDSTLAPLRWPCPYEAATSAIAKSAPIKILIFRHLSYLQNVLRRRRTGRSVEDAIHGAMQTYRYWNTTYGAFYRDLVRHYDSLPTRIKSWFVCIYIPWHLASMMLANMIDQVDNRGLGIAEHTATRMKSNMTARMRKSSATELADLAAVTVPASEGSNLAQQLPEYHFAVNEGPLMTEPWTVILVRAFAKAALHHLDAAEGLRRHDLDVLGLESEELQESMRRAGDCVKALRSLGKKSGMAKRIAKLLGAALERG